MARIVAIDTTGEFGSIALLDETKVVEEILLHSPDGFGHILFPRLQQLLEAHGWNIAEIDCFAAAAGPGSFTGVRVGLAAMKGLAEAASKPVVAASNLQALAVFGTAQLRAVLADARRGQIYGAVYDNELRLIQEEIVSAFPDWLLTLPEGDLEFIATDFAPFQPALTGTRFATTPVRQAPRALAAAIGQIAHALYRRGEALDPATIDANYVRRSDAELFWKE
ncbi:MAG TPA: tRNA (adenosine(37)-N6)-threonylcarbamoyltransferase complex dimerization subunit type 1 TsaB [Bryobacteraceae bacterium]|nr:tRNA (adenosine(37)-N6)-threonylcarbamoyltransferase complex dimerization subunit type 1 TsaB [Bryobacteraceae bacterium]